MVGLILSSRYIKPNRAVKRYNLLRYISTRENVELINNAEHLPATLKQQELIRKLAKSIPNFQDSYEYQDYLANPTIKNAGELIILAIEQNIDRLADRSLLLQYMANRPRVERVGKHGLFSFNDQLINLHQVQKQIAEHQGNVWTLVLSLRREDAARLGYDQAAKWKQLVSAKMPELAQQMKIPLDDLAWYAAFHNEGHHPHIHLIVYSGNPRKGFLTKIGLVNLKRSFASEIFRNERTQTFQAKTQVRENIKEYSQAKVKELALAIQDKQHCNPALENMLIDLAIRLNGLSGKKVYGYLSKTNRALVDKIVVELSLDQQMLELYSQWCKLQDQINSAYRNSPQVYPDLVDNKEFKSVKNMIIREAVKLNDELIKVSVEEESNAEHGSNNSRMAAVIAGGVIDVFYHASRMICNACEENYDKHFTPTVDKKLLQKEAERKQDIGIRLR